MFVLVVVFEREYVDVCMYMHVVMYASVSDIAVVFMFTFVLLRVVAGVCVHAVLSLCMSVCVCTDVFSCVYEGVFVYMDVCGSMCVFVSVCVCMRVFVFVYGLTFAWLCVFTHARVCVCAWMVLRLSVLLYLFMCVCGGCMRLCML